MSWQALLVLGLLFGVAYGFLFQKGDLCFVAAFRDLYAFRDTRVLRGIVPAVWIALLGWAVLLQTGLAPASRLWVPPAGVSSLLGGVLFGIGMYVAGSCASGTLYRAGMGYVHFWIVFAAMGTGYLTFAALYEPYLAPVLQRLTPLSPATLYAYSPLPMLPTALLVVALAVVLIVRVTGWSGLVRHVREALASAGPWASCCEHARGTPARWASAWACWWCCSSRCGRPLGSPPPRRASRRWWRRRWRARAGCGTTPTWVPSSPAIPG